MPKSLFINESLSQKCLTEMCLIYLLDFNSREPATEVNHNELPFLAHAAFALDVPSNFSLRKRSGSCLKTALAAF